MKRYNFLKKFYNDCLIIFIKNNKLISYDDLFLVFKSKEELECRNISYIIFDNLKIIDYCFFKENNYFFYKLLINVLNNKGK